MITTILWDVDATLLDFLAAEKAAIKKLFQEFDLGECTDEMIRRYSKINRSYWEQLECGELTKPEVLVGRILCKHDDCLVFCDSACEAVGYGDSISGRTETGSLGASEDDSESGGELSNHTGAESIFEEFTLSKEIKTGRISKSIKTHRKLQEQREKYNWKMRKRYIEITVE